MPSRRIFPYIQDADHQYIFGESDFEFRIYIIVALEYRNCESQNRFYKKAPHVRGARLGGLQLVELLGRRLEPDSCVLEELGVGVIRSDGVAVGV